MAALRFLFTAMAPKRTKDCPLQGIPKMLYIDNGAFGRSKLFRRVMVQLGVEVRTHMPKDSDGRRTTARAKGKVERSFRTIKDTFEKLYHFHQPATLAEANDWLHQYLLRYNRMPHRSEDHSRVEDWIGHLPPDGFREMCSWERFCTFARDPEQRKADSEACVSVNGVRYQLDYAMAGQEVTLLWGLFDDQLHVEFEQEKHGPFYPAGGPVQLGTFRKPRKSAAEQRADHIGELAKHINIPRAALSGEKTAITALLRETGILQADPPKAVPFVDTDPLKPTVFSNAIEAKMAIAEFLGCPLARLAPAQIDEINRILEQTLERESVMAQVRDYFTLSVKNGSRG